MKKFLIELKKILSFKMAASLFLLGFLSLSSTQANEEDDDLEGAFGALQQSMGLEATKADQKDIDSTLQQTFNAMPAEILKSTISVEALNPEISMKSAEKISNLPIAEDFDFQFQSRGMALSLALWSGSREELTTLFKNLVSQLYSDLDQKNLKLLLNSSPLPIVKAENVDFNDEKRKRLTRDAEYEFQEWLKRSSAQERALPSAPKGPVAVNVKPRMGLHIEISAGALASFKSVDELAGQIAKAMAFANPQVYGYKEDLRFTKNQKVIGMIELAIENGPKAIKKEIEKNREVITAELSAIERMIKAGFNPLALAKYEERVQGWLADVFMQSKNHRLARFLLNTESLKLEDWSRPLRLQIQEQYVFHLQSTRSGSPVNFSEQEFSFRLRLLRWRLSLYSRPFLMGTILQATPFVLAGSTLLSAVLFPEAVAHALAALNATDTLFAQKLAQFSDTGSSIGALVRRTVQKAPAVTTTVLNFDYLSATWRELSAKALGHVQFYQSIYEYSAYAISMTMAGAFVVRNALSIKSFFLSMKQSFDENIEKKAANSYREAERLTNEEAQLPTRPADIDTWTTSVPNNDRNDANFEKNTKVNDDLVGSTGAYEGNFKDRWATRLGSSLAFFLNAVPQTPILVRDWYELKKQQISGATEKGKKSWARGVETSGIIYVRGKEKMRETGPALRRWRDGTLVFIREDAKETREHALALQRFAVAGYAASVKAKDRAKVKVGKAATRTLDIASSAWKALGAVAKATPEAAEKTFDFTLVCGAALGRGLGITGNYVFWKLPVATLKGSVAMGTSMWESTVATSQAIRDSIKEDLAAAQLRGQMLREGIYRRESFFNDESVQPQEVLLRIKGIISIFDSQAEGRWKQDVDFGISKDLKPAGLKLILLQLFNKWLQQEQTWGATPGEFYALIKIFSNYWANPGGHWLRSDDEFEKLSLRFYERVVAQKSDSLLETLRTGKSNGPKYQNNSSFELFLLMRGELKQAEIVKEGESIVGNIILANSSGHNEMATEALRGNLSLIAKSVTEPAMTIQQFKAFQVAVDSIARNMNFISSLRLKNSFSEIVSGLNSMQKMKLEVYTHRSGRQDGSLDIILTKSAKESLRFAVVETIDGWIANSANVKELARTVEKNCSEYQLAPSSLSLDLWRALRKSPHLIKDFEDFDVLFQRDYFWSEVRNSQSVSVLEWPLQEVLNAKREQYGKSNSSWSYDPIESEVSHAIVKKRLEELGLFPTTYEGKLHFYKGLTLRGVSTITDELLSELLKLGNPTQIAELENFAVVEGRVFDQGVSDEFAIRQIKKSDDYHYLLTLDSSQKEERMIVLNRVIQHAQYLMSDLGVRYVDFLEELSAQIKSDYKEAEQIHIAKAQRYVQNAAKQLKGNQDTRISMLTRIVPEIKKWKSKDQYDFLLYLRGGPNDKPTKFIEAQFPTFGPERVRKIFQGLPIEAAMTVVNLYLKETLLARKNVNQGYGKKLIQYLVQNDENPEVQEYSTLLLEGLLHGIAQKDERFQIYILSSLIAMKPSQKTSIGETMKLILEQFPGVGPKIGQFLVGTGLLTEEINNVLIDTQDQTLPQKRFDVFSDLARVVGRGEDIGITLGNSLGEGSLKYSYSGVEQTSQMKVALQVFREDVQNNSDFQVDVLNGTIDYLIKNGGKKWSFLRVIVDGAMSAVRREKEFGEEARKTATARKIYSNFDSEQFTIRVPNQKFINQRLLVSRFAKGGSYLRMAREGILDAEDKLKIGLKILEMEAQILFNSKEEVTIYDTDRHSGNYLIDVEIRNGRKHYLITPIDFGQLTSIQKTQKENVAKLFALAGLQGSLGANDWTATKIGEILNMSGPMLERLKKNLPEYFPIKKQALTKDAVVRHYFSLLAAINETVQEFSKEHWTGEFSEGKLSLVYTDFVRAIIQLNQYEKEIEKFTELPKEAITPMRILDSKAKDMLAEYSKDNQLSLKQTLALTLLNSERWVQAKWAQQPYQPIKIRFNRQELDDVKMMAGVSRAKEALPGSSAEKKSTSARENSKTTRIITCQDLLKAL